MAEKFKKIQLCRNCLFFFFFLSIKRKNPHKNNTTTAIKYLPQMLWYAFHWSINELSCQTRLQIYLLCITGKKQCMKPKLQSHTNPSIWQRSQNQIQGFAKSVKLRGKKENSEPLWPAFRSNTDRRMKHVSRKNKNCRCCLWRHICISNRLNSHVQNLLQIETEPINIYSLYMAPNLSKNSTFCWHSPRYKINLSHHD